MTGSFDIVCRECITINRVDDDYNNEGLVEINVVGLEVIEIKCKECGNTKTIYTGEEAK